MLEIRNVSKTYGKKTVLSNVSFTAKTGKITGFLGPNGAGKSTTIHIMLGLTKANTGSALVNGQPYPSLKSPLSVAGSVLQTKTAPPIRSAYKHLLTIAATHGIGTKRVNKIFTMTGLEKIANTKVQDLSVDMRKRLSIAAALLGDPENLILDEPIKNLDPDGVVWVRDLLKNFAAQGKTVFLSSHLMSEIVLTSDQVVVIDKGKILANKSVKKCLEQSSLNRMQVSTNNVALLQQVLAFAGGEIHSTQAQTLKVSRLSIEQIKQIAFTKNLFIYEIKNLGISLEDAYLTLKQKEIVHANK